MESETGFAEGSRFNVHNGSWNLNNSRKRRRTIGGHDHHNLVIDASREGRGLIPKPPLYFVLKYMAPLILAPVTLRYESKTESPRKILHGLVFSCIHLCLQSNSWRMSAVLLYNIVITICLDDIRTKGDQQPCYITFSYWGQKFSSKPPFYSVLKYMAPSILTLVALRYQGKTGGLFQENPVPTWCFLVATCVYYLIAGLMEQTQMCETKWSRIFKRFAIVSGVFSVVSLVSIFLPYPMSIVPLIICIAIQSVILAWTLLCHAYNLIHRGIIGVLDNIRAKCVCIRGCNLKNEVGLPV